MRVADIDYLVTQLTCNVCSPRYFSVFVSLIISDLNACFKRSYAYRFVFFFFSFYLFLCSISRVRSFSRSSRNVETQIVIIERHSKGAITRMSDPGTNDRKIQGNLPLLSSITTTSTSLSLPAIPSYFNPIVTSIPANTKFPLSE